METFAKPGRLMDDPRFDTERKRILKDLTLSKIDAPIRDLIRGFVNLPHCFTLQCCFGHFVHSRATSIDNLRPLPEYDVGVITYRIAYVALCIKNSVAGNRLYSALADIPSIDPEYIQFGSPRWFWERHINSFALQVGPPRFAFQDQADIDYAEALHVQKVRDRFFSGLESLVHGYINDE